MRGKILYPQRAGQFNDFSGLRYGNMTPSDIDGHLEYHGIAHIFYEMKKNGAPYQYGQQLAHERLTDDLAEEKPTLFILGRHDIDDPQQDIPVAESAVERFRFNGIWSETDNSIKELTDDFIKRVNGGKCEAKETMPLDEAMFSGLPKLKQEEEAES